MSESTDDPVFEPERAEAQRPARAARVGLWGWLLRATAVGYPLGLLAVWAGFRFIGERWWVTTAGLYLPRVLLGLPLPVLALALLFRGARALRLGCLALAALLLVFPLMGLRLGGARAPTPGVPRLRVLTLNVATGSFGTNAVLDLLRASDADVIVLQEVHGRQYDELRAGLGSGGYALDITGQFLLASRFPIDEVVQPPRLLNQGVVRSPRFMRYRVRTPAGPVRVYDVHPISPRDALDDLRGDGLRQELASGRLLRGGAAPKVRANASLRLAQLEAVATDAAASPDPVIIAGDTNLPQGSWALRRWLGMYRDGFEEVGRGFGFTFPAPKHPWMHIDRILVGGPAGGGLRFLRFEVVARAASDHLAVWADIELPPAPATR